MQEHLRRGGIPTEPQLKEPVLHLRCGRQVQHLGYGVGSEQAGAGYGSANNVLSIRGCVCVTVGGKARKRSLRCEKINGNHYALMEVISTLV